MKRITKFFYLPVLLVSFFLSSCNPEKKTTKFSAVKNTPSASPYIANKKIIDTPKTSTPPNESENRESSIINKYASILGVPKSHITNYGLYNFIDAWYGTPYKYAGRDQSGIDCSDLASLIFQNVYNINLSGTVADIYHQCKPIKISELREGDLLFFKINSKSFSHVGVYLQNGKFVHASVHSGVIIDNLDENYYKKYFRGAGRVLN